MASRKRRKRKTYAGYKSKKQWRWAFATKKSWAREKARKTKGGKKVRYRRLPESKGSPAKRVTRKRKTTRRKKK